jgi:hypothetical protein
VKKASRSVFLNTDHKQGCTEADSQGFAASAQPVFRTGNSIKAVSCDIIISNRYASGSGYRFWKVGDKRIFASWGTRPSGHYTVAPRLLIRKSSIHVFCSNLSRKILSVLRKKWEHGFESLRTIYIEVADEPSAAEKNVRNRGFRK